MSCRSFYSSVELFWVSGPPFCDYHCATIMNELSSWVDKLTILFAVFWLNITVFKFTSSRMHIYLIFVRNGLLFQYFGGQIGAASSMFFILMQLSIRETKS